MLRLCAAVTDLMCVVFQTLCVVNVAEKGKEKDTATNRGEQNRMCVTRYSVWIFFQMVAIQQK